MSLHFGTDGVRGVALSELSTEFVARLGRACAEVLGTGRWLVGRDTRESGEVLATAVAAGLRAGGAEPVDVGVVPTPALAWLAARHDVAAAMVTASHNPWHDNGVKVFARGGLKLPDHQERLLESTLQHTSFGPSWLDTSHEEPKLMLPGEYVEGMVARAARLDGLRVVLDCANGAMSAVAPEVVRRLGANVVVINASPDGRNINANCGATHTAPLQQAVIEHGAALGLAFDGDGDRVIAVDHEGRVVDGDRLIALAALRLRDVGALRGDAVVVTVMSNLGFHRAMAAAGIGVVTTAVGDRYVLEALDDRGLSIGGEQSGHIIYRDLATTGDGLLAGLELAASVHARADGRTLAELAGSVMTAFPQVLVNVAVAERHPNIAEELAEDISVVEQALGGEGRVLLRASGTEPLVRVMVEAAEEDLARRAADDLAAIVRRRLG